MALYAVIFPSESSLRYIEGRESTTPILHELLHRAIFFCFSRRLPLSCTGGFRIFRLTVHLGYTDGSLRLLARVIYTMSTFWFITQRGVDDSHFVLVS